MGPFSKLATGLSPAVWQQKHSSSPPPYTEAVNYNTATSFVSPGAFAPTTQLQIHATGVTSCSSLSTQDPVPIPVFRVQPGSHSFSFDSIASEYVSLRIKRGSNSCALIRGSDPNGTPLNATVYRWGPGRAPRIRMFPPHSSASVEEAIRADDIECDVVEVRSRSIISRAQKVATPFGTFQWRYGSRSERKEAFGANSLLVLEKIDITSGGETEKSHPRVAQLVRNEEFRTPGTNKFMAGNGGRLMIDLRMWADEKGADAAKVEAFIVASCICMLKKEVDRMRDNTLAAVV
ncbi:hypothetical protein GQ53DRAFT_796425 [Thozetella sp. PMI_491]|nr:hypothetical protein GQ53DRAFT_796425 [Thozetella sp. PMI_491]